MPDVRPTEIHGGCANAASCILGAIGLGSLVPESARFELRMTLSDFDAAVLPVLIGPHAFDVEGTALDEDLVAALDRLPKTWGDGDSLRFTDPNYWIESIPETPELAAEILHVTFKHVI